MKFVYSVWFRNPNTTPDDQDYEWVACFVIDAADSQAALAWGDHIAQRYAARVRDVLLSSEVTDISLAEGSDLDQLPMVADGEDVSDEIIGW